MSTCSLAFREHRRNVSFLQVAPPSRETITQYREISDQLDTACGRVMGRFAELDWHPLNYVKRAYRQSTLAGLYRAARRVPRDAVARWHESGRA